MERCHLTAMSLCVFVAVCLWFGIFTFKSMTEEGLHWVWEGFGDFKIGVWEDLKIKSVGDSKHSVVRRYPSALGLESQRTSA